MADILHTSDKMQAELVRAALQAQGIRSAVLDDFHAMHFVVRVSDDDAARAIAIRKTVESGGGAPPARAPVSRKALIIAALVFVGLWALARWWRVRG